MVKVKYGGSPRKIFSTRRGPMMPKVSKLKIPKKIRIPRSSTSSIRDRGVKTKVRNGIIIIVVILILLGIIFALNEMFGWSLFSNTDNGDENEEGGDIGGSISSVVTRWRKKLFNI